MVILAKLGHMVLEQVVDVVFTIVPAIHDHLYLRVPEELQIREQATDGLRIDDITGNFPIIEREIGLLAEDQSQFQLGQAVMLFVMTILHLTEGFGVAGEGCRVICPKLLPQPPFSLQGEKSVFILLGDTGEQLTTAL